MTRRTRLSPSATLERALGLPAALAIGVGTMVGAGIFVFPGLAAERAGPAAMLSFTLGGFVALLVAVCTAELATAMPESGGGYHFVSRTLGPAAGALAGIGQVLGLVFAGAFYLVAFGRYVDDLLVDLGMASASLQTTTALGTAVALGVVNLVGTRHAGRLQRAMAIGLTALLTCVFGYGALVAIAASDVSTDTTSFAPHGTGPVLTTAAMVFTSYLGFVQIVTVAGEVRDPHRTLPRALIGSVVFVTALYVVTLYVTTSLLSDERVTELGDEATVAVARELLGPRGGSLMLIAGVLATLSSANASILSASRALFALGRDGIVPALFHRVGERFRTPFVALLGVSSGMAGLTLLERLDLLAEAASVLHLGLYGLICSALVSLRLHPASWFQPSFRIRGGTLVGGSGLVASLALLLFMQPLALGIGAGALILATVWYRAYARTRVDVSPRDRDPG